MLGQLCYLYGFNLQFAERLVNDIPDDQMAAQPGGVINHPAWSLGHLVVSSNHLGGLLGLEPSLPEGWGDAFTTGGEPSGNRADYPSKEALLEALTAQHERNTAALKAYDLARFDEPFPDEKTRAYFPTIGDFIMFLMTSHEMDHLGQIAAWRRAAGLGGS